MLWINIVMSFLSTLLECYSITSMLPLTSCAKCSALILILAFVFWRSPPCTSRNSFMVIILNMSQIALRVNLDLNLERFSSSELILHMYSIVDCSWVRMPCTVFSFDSAMLLPSTRIVDWSWHVPSYMLQYSLNTFSLNSRSALDVNCFWSDGASLSADCN